MKRTQSFVLLLALLFGVGVRAQEVTDSRLTVNDFQSRNSETVFTEEMVKSNIPSEKSFRFLFAYCTQPYACEEDECWLYYDKNSQQLIARPSHQEMASGGRLRWSLKIQGPIIDSLAVLTEVAINSATHRENIGDDGTYYLFIFEDGSAATTWSPKKGSNCRRLVGLYREVCRAVKNSDPVSLEALQPRVDEMIRIFRRYYSKEWRR